MMQKQTLIIAAVALVIGLGGGYWGGHAFASGTTTPTNGTFTRGGGGAGTFAGGRGAGGAGGGFLSGTVAAKDATSVTIDTRDGSSHVVLVSPTVSVAKSVAGTLADVGIGSTVIVMGTTNSDGSLSATSIQLRPAMTQSSTTTQ
jgi:hypothetical protein